MRSATLWLATLVILGAAVPARAHHPWPETPAVPLTKAWFPIGFDDKNLVQIVVRGTLTSSCLFAGPSDSAVDTVKRTITIRQRALAYPGSCAAAAIPFERTVDVGILPPGTYSVLDATTGKMLGQIAVHSVPGKTGVGPFTDDYVYALVKDAFLWRDSDNNRLDVVLDLWLPDRCTRLRAPKVDVYDEAIVVLPWTQRLELASCVGGEPYRVRVRVPIRADLHGERLLHVRSLYGRAVSKVVEAEREIDGP